MVEPESVETMGRQAKVKSRAQRPKVVLTSRWSWILVSPRQIRVGWGHQMRSRVAKWSQQGWYQGTVWNQQRRIEWEAGQDQQQ